MAVLATGCGAVKRMAINNVASTLSETGTTFTADDDPEVVRGSLDFALKLYESLLASVPENRDLLRATCSLATQYAFGFLQPDAEALQFDDYERSRELSDRALRMALRGRGYCWRAMDLTFDDVSARIRTDPAGTVARLDVDRDDVPLLYWSAASLGAAISLGGLDRPDLLIDWPVVRALAERALALDETFERGALHELMIAVESQGEALGGSEARAREHFARAVKIQQGLSPGPYVALAVGIAKPNQNREEFERLLGEALAVDPEVDPDYRLITLLAQRRARVLLAQAEDLILE